MEDTTPQPAPIDLPDITDVGDAADLTEGTTHKSGSEDKRYKYR